MVELACFPSRLPRKSWKGFFKGLESWKVKGCFSESGNARKASDPVGGVDTGTEDGTGHPEVPESPGSFQVPPNPTPSGIS